MGHMYPEPLSKLMMKQIFSKGSASVDDFIAKAKKDGVGVNCAEGGYTEDYMYELAFDVLLEHHGAEQFNLKGETMAQVEFVDMTQEQKKAFDVWQSGDLWDCDPDDGGDELFAAWKSIKWKFTKGMRQKYLDKEIVHLAYWGN